MAWSVILSAYGADPVTAEVELFSILYLTSSCRLVFKHLLFHYENILVKNKQNFPRIKLL
jgi:hypothetical protein